MNVEVFCFDAGRSREGAWIEIAAYNNQLSNVAGRSREGAWIEINYVGNVGVVGTGRSREGAWIEIFRMLLILLICFGSLP